LWHVVPNLGQAGFDFGQSHAFCAVDFDQSVFSSKIIQWVEIRSILSGQKIWHVFVITLDCAGLFEMAQGLVESRNNLLHGHVGVDGIEKRA
jgi:hypothetical protein